MSDTDLELLARHARNRDEDAFAEIVRRHLALVHSAALRQVRSPELAEEVAQTTFLKLARQAPRLAPGTVLAGWLYQVARHTAIDVVRREAGRQRREQTATEMNAMHTDEPARGHAPEPDADWSQIAPLLDEAMHALDETDRAAVLLRYFENKSLREVGAAIGASENAAQKRLARAVERLRAFFSKCGVTVGTGVLAALLSAHAVQAAPAGLIVAISSAAALPQTTVTAAATALAMTTLQKSLFAIVIVAAVGTGGIGLYQAHQNSLLRDRLAALQATPAAPPPAAATSSTADEFSFQPGEHLDGNAAPAIVGRAFTITALFDTQQQDGVIIAQGGLAHGYALYVQGGELCFAIRRNNALTTACAGPVSAGRHTATASFSLEGELRLMLDNQPPATARAAGAITLVPADGLDVGADRGGLVGPYADANPFRGTIETVKLKLARPTAP